jgi:hypothetical protein
VARIDSSASGTVVAIPIHDVNMIDEFADASSSGGRGSPSSSNVTAASSQLARPTTCRCDARKVGAVHAYLHKQFPDCMLRDLHAPSRLMQAGLPMPYAEHHVVRITHEGILPYYAVLLNDFQQHSVEEIEECLGQWDFAATVRANRIAIASKNGASAL